MKPVSPELLQSLVAEIGEPEPDPMPAAHHNGNGAGAAPGGDACWNCIDKIERSVSGQRGHNRLWRAAQYCVGTFGLSDSEAADMLHRWNVGCQPEWEDKDIVHKIEQVRTNARQTPQRKDFKKSNGTGTAAQNSTPAKPASPATATAICLADVEAKPVEWLWPRRLPKGCITLLDGDPGLGKSYIALDIAARLTNGQPMPEGDALWLNPETF